MSLDVNPKIALLKDRAHMLAKVRKFFEERKILEVDTPILSKSAPIDAHIDVMEISLKGEEKGFLHTSPEYAMKRLLSLGTGDIYQLSHVFREGEIGPLHNPEFTMIEWYRIGFSLDDLIQETLELISLFIDTSPPTFFSYREALLKFAEIDYVNASIEELVSCIKNRGISVSESAYLWDKDTLLQFITTFIVEPHFQNLSVLRDYPASQSALAKTTFRGEENVAERFEIYFQGIELANGFHELTDAIEQERRLNASNNEREKMGKNRLPLDPHFLLALQKGLPDCAGVAVGFDRLMLLRHSKKNLKEILPLSWEEV